MEDVVGVQPSEPEEHLDEHVPDLLLSEEQFGFLVLDDLLVQVAIVSELHDDAELVGGYQRFLPSRKTSL
jgi:hypothetical protein